MDDRTPRADPPTTDRGIVTRKRLLLHKSRRGGDSKPFAYIPVEVAMSDAGRTLPHVAFRVMVTLAAQYGGKNNGSLSLTRAKAMQYGIADSHALGASLRELELRGLIIQTRPGSRLPPRSALYAIAWRPIDHAHPSDPHDAAASVKPPDGWRGWIAAEHGIRWNVKRRAPRSGITFDNPKIEEQERPKALARRNRGRFSKDGGHESATTVAKGKTVQKVAKAVGTKRRRSPMMAVPTTLRGHVPTTTGGHVPSKAAVFPVGTYTPSHISGVGGSAAHAGMQPDVDRWSGEGGLSASSVTRASLAC